MGAAVPVVGAVMGVASAVQQHNAAQQQANAQRQALAQQSLVEQNNTKLRLIELERQKLYSDFNFQIQTASREIAKFADEQQMNLAQQQDEMNRNAQRFQLQSAGVRQRQEALGLDQAAAQGEFQSDMQARGILTAESEQGRQAMMNEANMLAALEGRQQEQDRNLASAFAQFSAGEVAGLSMSDVYNLQNAQMLADSESINALQRYQGLFDQVMQGRLNAEEVARLVSEYGRNEAQFMRQSAQNSRQYINTSEAAAMADMNSIAAQNAAAFNAARSAQNTSYLLEEANQRLNQSYYDIQNKSDAATIRNTSAQNQAALAIQRSSIQNPSSFGLLGAIAQGGMSIANVFANRQPQQQQPQVNFSSQPLPGSYQFPGYGQSGFITGYGGY